MNLLKYIAPVTERALVKQVPIELLESVRLFYKLQNTPIRIRYRGPRRDGMRLTTLRRDAVRFTVYPKV